MSVSKGKMFKLYLENCVFIGFFSGVFYSVIDIIKFIYNDASLSVILMPVLYPFTSLIEFLFLVLFLGLFINFISEIVVDDWILDATSILVF